MSDFSLTLVLQIKSSKIINGMAKVQIKSERITPFGEIFHVREQFSRYVGPVIDKVLDVTLSPITFISHLNKPPDETVTCPCVLCFIILNEIKSCPQYCWFQVVQRYKLMTDISVILDIG